MPVEVDKDVDEEVDMHSNLRWWTRMWMIQIADLAVKKYKSGINTYVVKIQKLTILISPLLFEAQIGIDLQKKHKFREISTHALCV